MSAAWTPEAVQRMSMDELESAADELEASLRPGDRPRAGGASLTDERVLQLARQHLDAGLCHDRTARITRATDAELLAFVRACLAEAR